MRRRKYCFIITFISLLYMLWWFIDTSSYKSSSSLRAVTRLHEWAETYKYPVILVDPFILKEILRGSDQFDEHCQYLCQKDALIFALDSKFIHDKSALIQQAREFSFSVNCHEHNPQWIDTRIITSCTFLLEGSFINIVIIHERKEADFLWLRFQPSKDGEIDTRALERFDTRSITLDTVELTIPRDIPTFSYNFQNGRYIDCNHTRASIFQQLYYKGETSKESVFRRNGLELIRSVKNALDALNVPFWLSSGTCLGWFRQCDLIPYTTDIDIGIFISQYNPSLVFGLQNAGFKLKYKFGLVSDSLQMKFVWHDIKMDIFFFYEESNYTWNGATQASTGIKYKYIFEPFTLCWTEFHQMKVRIPCETESYIRANYGPNWFEPVTSWHWKDSPPNARDNGRWSEEMFDEAMQMFE